MTALEKARAYFDAWNARDPEAVVTSMASGGTYQDPQTPQPVSGPALAGYVGGLLDAFPDLSFELVGVTPTGDNSVSAQWIMRGTNNGSMRGLPPTGKSIELYGADFLETSDEGVTKVVGYFDSGVIPRQIGMQVIVQPDVVGPFQFGHSIRVSTGDPTPPGAFTSTMIIVRSDEERERVSSFSRPILQELLGEEGFLSGIVGSVGDRMFTTTTWKTADDAARAFRGGTHKEAISEFFNNDLGIRGVTMVYEPHHLNTMWKRGEDGKMAPADADGPDAIPYW